MNPLLQKLKKSDLWLMQLDQENSLPNKLFREREKERENRLNLL